MRGIGEGDGWVGGREREREKERGGLDTGMDEWEGERQTNR